MKRRDSIQRLMTLTGALTLLPTWAQAWDGNTLKAAKLFASDESEILSSVTDTLIPATDDGLGALPLGLDNYLTKLFAECYDTSVQNDIKLFLKGLNDAAQNIYEIPFVEGVQQQRQQILESASNDPVFAETFSLIKNETIRGFRTSRIVLTEYYGYKVAPGVYIGCADIEST